jgi:hypothetical protein
MTHAEIAPSPFKLRLRARRADDASPTASIPRKRITKRTHAAPPRGLNKRRRASDDDMSREAADRDDNCLEEEEDAAVERPSTPKRMRLAPEVLPLGLERSDFHDLRLNTMEQAPLGEGLLESVEGEETQGTGEDEWSTEEDRLLVELVLEKLKLSKSDWQDCARSLGKDRGKVGRRWKSLMSSGEVGIKSRPRRGKINQTWR